MQKIADIAALVAARDVFAAERGAGVAQSVADTILEAHNPHITQNSTIATTVDAQARTVAVTMRRPRDVAFASLFDIPLGDHVVRATARLPRTPPLCLMSLNLTETRSFDLSGGGDVDTPGCSVQVNSGAPIALEASNNSRMAAAEFCVVGGYSASGTSLSPQPRTRCDQMGDPLAGIVPQVYPKDCDFTNVRTRNNEEVELEPGVYCGGLDFGSGSEVELEPGEYYIMGGPLTFGSARVYGRNVVFYLVDAQAAVRINGSANIHLEGRRTGLLAGFVIVANPAITSEVASDFNGAAVMYLEGTVYLRTHDVKFAGTAETSDSPYLAIVSDTLNFTGTTDYTINTNYALSKVPLPLALKIATAASAVLIE